MRMAILLLLSSALAVPANAQWTLEDSHTTASLRGIHNVGGGVAWASGTNGTVLRTEDGGYLWQTCSMPPGAERLDFRGIQAFDEKTAIVMSSGKGDLSRLYKTTDACQTWKLVFTNPDKEGFWDAIQFTPNAMDKTERCFGVLAGDPVNGVFPMFLSFDCGENWERQLKSSPAALPQEGLFAASNSSLLLDHTNRRAFVTGGTAGARIISYLVESDDTAEEKDFEAEVAPGAKKVTYRPRHLQAEMLPWSGRSTASGAFAIAARYHGPKGSFNQLVIVGGDYSKPNEPGLATTGFMFSRSSDWHMAQTSPHGYRSAVAYDSDHKLWITVGPNGTDISRDDGKNWQPLKPGKEDAPGANRDWNALSLPFVVGPKGRIGRLNTNALEPPSK